MKAKVGAGGSHANKGSEPSKASTSFSSNWEAMKSKVGANGDGTVKKRKREEERAEKGGGSSSVKTETKQMEAKGSSHEITQVLAVDCEMVGVGPDGKRSSIARVCVINDEGNVLLDAFVKQKVSSYYLSHPPPSYSYDEVNL